MREVASPYSHSHMHIKEMGIKGTRISMCVLREGWTLFCPRLLGAISLFAFHAVVSIFYVHLSHSDSHFLNSDSVLINRY